MVIWLVVWNMFCFSVFGLMIPSDELIFFRGVGLKPQSSGLFGVSASRPRLLIYPEMDEPVLDIWINSLRTTAQTGFKMALGEPSHPAMGGRSPWMGFE